MTILKYKTSILKFLVYTFIFCIILLIIINNLSPKKEINRDLITKSIISNNYDDVTIYVEYPRFNNDEITKIITDYLYPYIKDFKFSSYARKLNITYDLYFFQKYVNVVFNIENNLNNTKYKNILINLKDDKIANITDIFDESLLKEKISNILYYKYYKDISNKIVNKNINDFTYIMNESKIDIFFDNINFENIDYIPMVSVIFDKSVSNVKKELDLNKKYISFTYDDGPCEYTKELLNTLELNNSSATFFMIGNRMKKYKNIVKDIYNSNSEIGSHTFSHKNLTLLSQKELEQELSKTNQIFNSITKDNLTYLRPPYDYYNSSLLKTNYNIVTWNIDPKDWLIRDSKKIYNEVIKNICDGCIVVMHDIYPETIEATKMLIPQLNSMEYEVVSISKLIEIKKYNMQKNKIISSIK